MLHPTTQTLSGLNWLPRVKVNEHRYTLFMISFGPRWSESHEPGAKMHYRVYSKSDYLEAVPGVVTLPQGTMNAEHSISSLGGLTPFMWYE